MLTLRRRRWPPSRCRLRRTDQRQPNGGLAIRLGSKPRPDADAPQPATRRVPRTRGWRGRGAFASTDYAKTTSRMSTMVSNPDGPSPRISRAARPRGSERPEQLEVPVGLGASLRRAWIGYQVRLDEAMSTAGFDDRRFPDGRVLRMCSDPAGTTISQIGRQLGITRQGAGKIVAALRDRGYVEVGASTSSGREKTVTLTPRATAYLTAQRKAARRIERQLGAEIGHEGLASLHQLLDALGGGEDLRMNVYLRRKLSHSGKPPTSRPQTGPANPPSPAATQQAPGEER